MRVAYFQLLPFIWEAYFLLEFSIFVFHRNAVNREVDRPRNDR